MSSKNQIFLYQAVITFVSAVKFSAWGSIEMSSCLKTASSGRSRNFSFEVLSFLAPEDVAGHS